MCIYMYVYAYEYVDSCIYTHILETELTLKVIFRSAEFFIYFYLFSGGVLLCTPAWLGLHYVYQAILNHRSTYPGLKT